MTCKDSINNWKFIQEQNLMFHTKFNCISSMPGLTVIKLSSFGDLKQPRYWSYVGDPMSSQSWPLPSNENCASEIMKVLYYNLILIKSKLLVFVNIYAILLAKNVITSIYQIIKYAWQRASLRCDHSDLQLVFFPDFPISVKGSKWGK
jgi:hypothetical protein